MGNVDLICRLHRGVDTKLRNNPDLLVGAAYIMTLKDIAPDIYDKCPEYVSCETNNDLIDPFLQWLYEYKEN